jgi:ketosteroid isomerase-like protein
MGRQYGWHILCAGNNMENEDTARPVHNAAEEAAQARKQSIMATSDDEAAIRALEDRFAAAFNAGDVDGIMKNYIPDNSLVVFDVVPRKQYLGADAYRKDWVDLFTHFKDTPKIAITDLGITVEGNLGFSHSFQRVTGTDRQGRSIDRTVRVTDGYRKIRGSWLIVLEHVSMPVDLTTGKPDVCP